jgi:hypothetical protein
MPIARRREHFDLGTIALAGNRSHPGRFPCRRCPPDGKEILGPRHQPTALVPAGRKHAFDTRAGLRAQALIRGHPIAGTSRRNEQVHGTFGIVRAFLARAAGPDGESDSENGDRVDPGAHA